MNKKSFFRKISNLILPKNHFHFSLQNLLQQVKKFYLPSNSFTNKKSCLPIRKKSLKESDDSLAKRTR